MKLKRNKLVLLFLVFSLMMLSGELYAKKRGAKLTITKKDVQLIEGELIAVKQDSLLLLDTEGKDVSVDIVEIKVIRIVKKSKIWEGARTGGVIGGVGGILLWLISEDAKVTLAPFAVLGSQIIIGGIIGVIVGAAIGESAGKDKTIQIEGMSDSEIQETMEKLRKKARIRDYK